MIKMDRPFSYSRHFHSFFRIFVRFPSIIVVTSIILCLTRNNYLIFQTIKKEGKVRMEKAMLVANNPFIWVIACLIIAVIAFQGIIFIRIASKTSASVGLSQHEVKTSLKVGAINSIGPSLGIMIIAISLITLLGNPLTLIRIGIIGSAATESMGASIAATSFGTELGSSSFTSQAFTTVAWVLSLGGCGWLLFVALFTKHLGKFQSSITNKTKDKGFPIMIIISTAAMLGIFGNLLTQELFKGYESVIVIIAAAITMIVVTLVANKFRKLKWLHEWSLGLAILTSLSVIYFII